jgi:hypothetical protein
MNSDINRFHISFWNTNRNAALELLMDQKIQIEILYLLRDSHFEFFKDFLTRFPAQDPSLDENRLLEWAMQNRRIDFIEMLMKDRRVTSTYKPNLELVFLNLVAL